jgi:hypothetical protein
VGADFGKPAVTTEKTVGSLPPSVQPLFEHGVLWELFVSGGSCKNVERGRNRRCEKGR